MITKTASLQAAAEIAAGVGLGHTKADKLSKKDQALLKDYYGLGQGANLKMRNIGRGITGSTLGSIPGAVLGTALGGRTTGNIGALAGSVLGAHLMTGKYSKGNAESISERMKRHFKE